MITAQQILNRIAKTLFQNFEKVGLASTLGEKFEVWFQIELMLGFFGEWDGLHNELYPKDKPQLHPTNNNLLREQPLHAKTAYMKTTRVADFIIAADGKQISGFSNPSECTYTIEIKHGIPNKAVDAYKDIYHALEPAQITDRYGKSKKDKGMAVFIINAQDPISKKRRSFHEQVKDVAQIAAKVFPSWAMLRNDEHAHPDFMVIAIVEFETPGLALVHYVNQTLWWHPKLEQLLKHSKRTISYMGNENKIEINMGRTSKSNEMDVETEQGNY